MSSFRTHALIGAVGGLALTKTSLILPAALAVNHGLALDALIITGSALLALWPDIDEPHSFISQRVRAFVALLSLPISAFLGWTIAVQRGMGNPWIVALTGGVLGLVVVGPILGTLVLKLIRAGAGGHRRLTHSLVTAAALGALAWWLWQRGIVGWMVPAALAYGVVLHDIGDIVTVSGVPVLYPLLSTPIRLPRMVAVFGEPLAALLALAVGGYLVWAR